MAETSTNKETHDVVVLNVNGAKSNAGSNIFVSVPFLQKLVAELVGTYFLIFIGGASVIVNANNENMVTLPGICMVWGLLVMGLVYTVGHISGAHFNPAVTLAFASIKRFPLKQVPAYILIQVVGSTLASVTLRLVFTGKHDHFIGTLLSGSYLQGFVVEFLVTFYLMFVISGVATDSRAIDELAGLVVGATVMINSLTAGLVTGASMNPARTLGPAIAWHEYRGIWVYMIAPVAGAVVGAWVYNIMRHTNKSSIHEITKSTSFLKGSSSSSCGAK
ncbi:nodulin-26-like [Prosopis cineraria]|uniref:nodulin-26-like n=1 Tax=Prosopis cineraria TaxID=364024 RepID=UPI00240FD107|nr:nodulin-26-like [Prosopis cineraria]